MNKRGGGLLVAGVAPALAEGTAGVKLPANEAKMGTKFITFDGKTGEEAATAEKHEEDEPDEDEEPIPSISLKYNARIRKCSP